MGDRTLGWGDAWQSLVYRNTPFRAAEDQDFQDLLRQLSALEQLFLETPSLRAYYAECMAPLDLPAAPAPAADPHEIVHVVAMQAQLMEDTFYSLRLDQYANAPGNRGWMNLFRRWGRSQVFVTHFTALATTFSADFVGFFQRYVRGWPPIDEAPVPHAWDVKALYAAPGTVRAEAGPAARVYEADAPTRTAVAACGMYPATGATVARGVYLDPGRREAGSAEDEPERVRKHEFGQGTGLIGETTDPTPDASPDRDE